jgi:hypothetical protein
MRTNCKRSALPIPVCTRASQGSKILGRWIARFSGAAAVINCAGPFLDTAAAVLDAALRARIHYFDVAAEQGAAVTVFQRFSIRAHEGRGGSDIPRWVSTALGRFARYGRKGGLGGHGTKSRSPSRSTAGCRHEALD